MEYMGPVRLKDVEETQQKIVASYASSKTRARFVVARSGEEEMVV
jgi:flagellar motor switch protein FliG